jgi:hypothetical protein
VVFVQKAQTGDINFMRGAGGVVREWMGKADTTEKITATTANIADILI